MFSCVLGTRTVLPSILWLASNLATSVAHPLLVASLIFARGCYCDLVLVRGPFNHTPKTTRARKVLDVRAVALIGRATGDLFALRRA